MRSPPSGGTDLDAVVRLFGETMHALMSRSSGTEIEVMNDSGLTIPQIIALHVLQQHGARTVGDIADKVKLSRAAASHLIDRLVCKGLVRREEDAEDRRQKRVTVSAQGEALLHRLLEARRESLAHAMRVLSPATVATLATALRAILDDISARGTPGGGSR